MADSFPGTAEPSLSRRRVLVWGSLAGALVAVLAASLWLSGAIPWFHDDPLPETVQKPRPVRRLQAEPLLAVAPAGLPAAVRDRYRPRPDRRLLLAVAEVQRLRRGTPPEPVQAEFRDGKWRILSGKDEVGTLPEIPTFDEATDLLARWAARPPSWPWRCDRRASGARSSRRARPRGSHRRDRRPTPPWGRTRARPARRPRGRSAGRPGDAAVRPAARPRG